LTALFRAIILMILISLVGFIVRWYLLNIITSLEPERVERFEEMAPEEESLEEEEASQPSAAENVE